MLGALCRRGSATPLDLAAAAGIPLHQMYHVLNRLRGQGRVKIDAIGFYVLAESSRTPGVSHP